MKSALVYASVLVLLASIPAKALTFQVEGVRGAVLLKKEIPAASGTLGKLSDKIFQTALQSHQISQYTGSDGGVASINDLGGASEVLNDRDMNAFGWCYTVDGTASDLMSDQFHLTGHEQSIRWFYVEAQMRNGAWVSMCTPADHAPSAEDRN